MEAYCALWLLLAAAGPLEELRRMERADQAARGGPPPYENVDRANTARLKELIKTHGWFTISKFGREADRTAWLLVQHADHDVAFQKEILGILAGLYPKGETDPHNYAYLWDRVAANTGARQRFGTQGKCTGRGKWEPFEVEDPAGLDARRKSVGLPAMRVYTRQVRRLCR